MITRPAFVPPERPGPVPSSFNGKIFYALSSHHYPFVDYPFVLWFSSRITGKTKLTNIEQDTDSYETAFDIR